MNIGTSGHENPPERLIPNQNLCSLHQPEVQTNRFTAYLLHNQCRAIAAVNILILTKNKSDKKTWHDSHPSAAAIATVQSVSHATASPCAVFRDNGVLYGSRGYISDDENGGTLQRACALQRRSAAAGSDD